MTRLLTRGRRRPAAKHRSPSETIELSDGVRLHHLEAAPGDQYPVPIVLVPSLLSKYQVFDIHPARSMAGFLRDHQFDVWIVDWGKPRRKRPTPDFESYVDDWLDEAVGTIVSHGDTGQVSMLGYSLGGVISTLYAASYPESVRNLITLTTPINFHRTGLTATWARYFPVDAFVDFWGNVPSWYITANFSAMAVTRVKPLWNAFGGDVFEAEGRSVVAEVARWMGDGVPVAGEMYRTLVSDLYKDNLLLRGGLPLAGRIVELKSITSSLLTITAGDDNLCPPQAAEALNRAVSSDDETAITVPGSHLGAVIGNRAHHLLWTRIVDWLESRSGHHPADWY